MKKIIALSLAVIMAFALCACSGGKTSNVSLDDVADALDVEFEQGSSDGEYIADGSEDLIPYVITVKADKKQNVSYIQIKCSEVKNTNSLTDSLSILDVVYRANNDIGSLTINDAGIVYCVTFSTMLCNLLRGHSPESDEEYEDCIKVFTDGSINLNGWSISSDLNSAARIVTITAAFKG